MKKLFIIILFLGFIPCVPVFGQERLRVEHVEVEQAGDSLRISFKPQWGDEYALRGTTCVYLPVITNGEFRVSLPAVVVQNGRAALSWNRRARAAGIQARYADGVYAAGKEEEFAYAATIPIQQWMYDSRIEVETLLAGCGEYTEDRYVLAAHILPGPPPEPEIPAATSIQTVPEPQPTTGETLAEAFSFVLPDSEFDPQQPIRFYEDERDNALTVFYRINRFAIEPDYASNEQTLVNLIAAIEIIRESLDAEVKRIVVAGFASPEGPFDFNDRLAWERAVSVKEYILKNSEIADPSVLLFNGSTDWRGLHLLVDRDLELPGRTEVLRILESRPLTDVATQKERMELIKKLHGGTTYQYMADRVFPLLRNGTFIRVYYENRTAPELK